MKLIQKLLLIAISMAFFQCSNLPQEKKPEADTVYQPPLDRTHEITPLPIQLEALTAEQQKAITALNDADTSSYLIHSRPVLFQIQGIKKSEGNQRRNTQPFYNDVDLFIYALGEAQDSTLVDYGWIENAVTGETVWEMTFENSVHGGGDLRNRKVVDNIQLPAGTYTLHFVYNGSHQNDDWQGAPPERPFYYGITVFNLFAIEQINALPEFGG